MTTAASALTTLLAITLLVSPAARAGEQEAPKKLDPKAGCISKDCHPDLARKKHVHGPISVGECKACHVWKDNKHTFTLAHEGTRLCTSCHDDIEIGEATKEGGEKKEAKKKLVVHEPAKEDCANCHDPHASDHKGILVAPVLELCETCHDETVAKARAKTTISKHSAILQGRACLTCHTPHTSHEDKRLRAALKDLCLGCHDHVIKANGHLVADTKAELDKKKLTHAPVEDEGCITCHAVHGSEYRDLLVKQFPEGFYAPFGPKAYALCFECHDAALAARAQTEDDTEFRNGKINLHHVHVNKTPKGRSCRFCHATHASNQPARVRTSVSFGRAGWKLPIGFSKTKTGGSCASGCHAPQTYDREKPVSYDVAQGAPKDPANQGETRPKGP